MQITCAEEFIFFHTEKLSFFTCELITQFLKNQNQALRSTFIRCLINYNSSTWCLRFIKYHFTYLGFFFLILHCFNQAKILNYTKYELCFSYLKDVAWKQKHEKYYWFCCCCLYVCLFIYLMDTKWILLILNKSHIPIMTAII